MEPLKSAMMGGACQVSDGAGGLGANPITNLFDQMINGDQMARQYEMQQQMNQLDPATQKMMEQQYQAMMRDSQMERDFEMMQRAKVINYQAQSRPSNDVLNSLWDSSGPQQTSGPQMGANPMMMGPMGANPMMMGPMSMGPMGMGNMGMMMPPAPMPQAQQMNPSQPEVKEAPAAVIEEAKEIPKADDVSAAAGDMISVLQNSDNPKYRNCKFLKFLKKLDYGAYEIKDDTLNKNQIKCEEFKQIEQERYQKDLERQASEEQAKTQAQRAQFTNILDKDKAINNEEFQDMMKQWEKDGMDKEMEELFMKEWSKSWETETTGEFKEKVVPLQENNPHMDAVDNLKEAKHLYQEGENHEALLHLEAEVTKNPDCAEAWRLMGVIYQEFDQDDIAIIAFKKAHSIDPYDLDCLLSIGISCTNELDERDAMNHLHQWLKLNPDFMDLPGIEKETLSFDEIKGAFMAANMKQPHDYKVYMALGVLAFIQRNFTDAQTHFQMAIKENPLDHSLWNKWAAALANALQTQPALDMYDLVLKMRPKYARIWVNIGIANNTLRRFDLAAQSFLSALAINPGATHLWNYLRSALVQLGKFDLVEAIDQRDVNLFRGDFTFLDLKALPPPNYADIYEHPLLNS